ncbi:MAG: RagB/SusD family nutrient uptake outer membrane protein, partial [Alistipes sp.]|nr:RagB/SusD family nutrient uptake outer membrane protein [Alistipes sp.]
LPQSVPAARNGEIRQAAAAMLKARFYLYDGDFENAAKICGEIMEGKYGHYELFQTKTPVYSSYEDLFTSANEFNVEVILSYSMMPIIREWSLNDKVPNSTVGSMGAYFFPTESLAKEYIKLDGQPFEYPTTNTSCYTDRDPRMDATIVRHNSVWRDVDLASGAATTKTINIVSDATDGINKGNATETGYYVRKWFDPAHRADMLISTDIIMMRYADVLLMYAESMNEIGQMSEQVWNSTIRPIRERAGFTQQGALQYPNLDQAAMREIIRRERRCELALEGLRYYDIIRWNAGLELLNFDLMSAKFTGTTEQSSIFKYKFTSRDMLWPVPQSQINNYPSLAPQNSGY